MSAKPPTTPPKPAAKAKLAAKAQPRTPKAESAKAPAKVAAAAPPEAKPTVAEPAVVMAAPAGIVPAAAPPEPPATPVAAEKPVAMTAEPPFMRATPPEAPAKIEPVAVKAEPAKMPVTPEPSFMRVEPPPATQAKLEPMARRDDPPKPANVEPLVIGGQAKGLQTTGPRLVTANSGLVASHLGKQFKRRPVLRDVTVSVQRGEAVGLLGPNGAGKTTCFYIITGLINADHGTIEMDGTDITHLPMYRRSRMGIGYLPQEASIFRGLTVEENIRAVLEVVEPERDMREAMLDDLLAEFSISHLRRTPALALSGGERRRVEIARALASRPQFMLLDEPLAGIDPIAIGEIRELITHLRKRGIGVLITDHNVRETLDIVDRAYILHDGSVLMDGRPSEIVAHQDVRRVYLGERFSL